ncbi:hypothetical protein SEA_THYATIRA_52 [Mycobacterium phage Thyatira]|uniref:Uncharacterized protein n=1 Tax=Mycobacterium phage Thyatira TaxID=2283261 RepID=A0A345M979_9CAUD|nr:hypothetical protein I5G76_gp49 [Mycobacterium phage Thyatira]AXH67050.1 hypothetical protein SEA_THYATIRA_52 [Mycobacterium phage Thyatira]
MSSGERNMVCWTTCPHCGKRSYTSRKEAKRAVSRFCGDRGGHMSPYRCHLDETRWHVGHLHTATRRGINYEERARQ